MHETTSNGTSRSAHRGASQRVWRSALAAGVVAGALVALPTTGASAAVAPKTADMNAGSFAGFDQTNATTGALTIDRSRSYEGGAAAHASYAGGGANGFARGIFNVGWANGDDVYYGGAFYLPAGFKAAMKSETDLMRHDNFGANSTTDYGGIGLLKSDGKYVASTPGSGSGDDMNVAAPFDVPEGRWFWLEVHQKLSPTTGVAVNEVWIDDQLVSSSSKANSYGRGVTRLRYGLVAIGEGAQSTPLDLWFDRAMVRSTRIGSSGAAAVDPGAGGTAAGSTSGGGTTSGGSSSAGGSSSGKGSTSGSGGQQGSRSDREQAGAVTARTATKKRVRLAQARIRHGRLALKVAASGRIARTDYRISRHTGYKRYAKPIRLSKRLRHHANVVVRVTLKDESRAKLRLHVHHGRVRAR
jgi:hypothetical protein